MFDWLKDLPGWVLASGIIALFFFILFVVLTWF